MTFAYRDRVNDTMTGALLGASEPEILNALAEERRHHIGRGGPAAWSDALRAELATTLTAAGLTNEDAALAIGSALAGHADPAARLEGLVYVTRLSQRSGLLADAIAELRSAPTP